MKSVMKQIGKLTNLGKGNYEKPVNKYAVYIQEEPGKKKIILSAIEVDEVFLGTVYANIKKTINEVKRLKDDYLRRGFKVETSLDLMGENKQGENAILVCPKCYVGHLAKIWHAYASKVEEYNLDEMMGLSRGG